MVFSGYLRHGFEANAYRDIGARVKHGARTERIVTYLQRS